MKSESSRSVGPKRNTSHRFDCGLLLQKRFSSMDNEAPERITQRAVARDSLYGRSTPYHYHGTSPAQSVPARTHFVSCIPRPFGAGHLPITDSGTKPRQVLMLLSPQPQPFNLQALPASPPKSWFLSEPFSLCRTNLAVQGGSEWNTEMSRHLRRFGLGRAHPVTFLRTRAVNPPSSASPGLRASR